MCYTYFLQQLILTAKQAQIPNIDATTIKATTITGIITAVAIVVSVSKSSMYNKQ